LILAANSTSSTGLVMEISFLGGGRKGVGPSGLTPRHAQQKIDALESSVGLVAEQSNRTEDPVMTDEMMTLRTLLEKSSGR
jgi:hypothetical protein